MPEPVVTTDLEEEAVRLTPAGSTLLTTARRAENMRLARTLSDNDLEHMMNLCEQTEPYYAEREVPVRFPINNEFCRKLIRQATIANDLPLYEAALADKEACLATLHDNFDVMLEAKNAALAEALSERAQMLEALRYVRSFGLHGDIEFTDVPEHRGCSVSFFVEQAIELGDKP